MSDLFIYNTNNQPNFISMQNPENNLSNSINNGNGFNEETKNFHKNQNLHHINLNAINSNVESNSFGNMSYPTFEQTKKISFETINMSKPNNENITRDFKNPSQNKINPRPFVTNVTPPFSTISKSANDEKNKDFINKMRRRSIKNNKIVFVHTANSAARKLVTEVKVYFF